MIKWMLVIIFTFIAVISILYQRTIHTIWNMNWAWRNIYLFFSFRIGFNFMGTINTSTISIIILTFTFNYLSSGGFNFLRCFWSFFWFLLSWNWRIIFVWNCWVIFFSWRNKNKMIKNKKNKMIKNKKKENFRF